MSISILVFSIVFHNRELGIDKSGVYQKMTTTRSEAASHKERVDPVEALDRPFVLPEEKQETQADVAAESTSVDIQTATQTRMNFRVGDIELLCATDASREVVDSPLVNRLPNSAPWFKGLANVHGGMTPVVDLGQALGNKQTNKNKPYLMIFGRGDNAIGLLINGIPQNITIGMTGKLNKPPSISDLIDGSVLAAYDIEKKIRFDIDINYLFKTLSQRLRLA